MITIYKGTALFDTVAIFDTEARNSVREGRAVMSRADARGAGVGGRGADRCGGYCCLGYAQDGGVVRMVDGVVTFKGGTISNTKAVSACMSRLHVAFASRMSHVANTQAGRCMLPTTLHVAIGMPSLDSCVQRMCSVVALSL